MKKFLTIPEAAEYMRISRVTLERIISRGGISVIHVSRKRRVISFEVIENYMKSCCRPAATGDSDGRMQESGK